MIGVVVWSNASREKAVVWCEDQASLAYLQGRADFLDPKGWPEPGDLVELDSDMVGELRHARRVSVLTEQGCPQLPKVLRSTLDDSRPDLHLRVVPLREPAERNQPAAQFDELPLRASAAGR